MAAVAAEGGGRGLPTEAAQVSGATPALIGVLMAHSAIILCL